MEEPFPPFVPPSGALPPAAEPAPTPTPASAPAPLPGPEPALTGLPIMVPPQPPQPPSYLPPPPPRPRRPNRGAVIGIVAGALALAVIIAGAIGASNLILANIGHHNSAAGSGSNAPSEPAAPHAGGAPSSITARDPLNCSASCFGNDLVVPSDTVPPPSAITPLGLPKKPDSLGDYASSDPGDEYDQTLKNWKKNRAAPAGCFFTYFSSPVVAELGNRPTDAATTIDYSGTYTDKAKNNILTQSVRLFANSEEATSYLRQLSAAIDACPKYRTTDDSGSLEIAVESARAFTDFPTSEAAVGWVESSYGGRYDSIDVQRGNLVVRTTLESYDGRVTEGQFRRFVNDDAWQIAAIRTPGAD